jgi:hypothetical protein
MSIIEKHSTIRVGKEHQHSTTHTMALEKANNIYNEKKTEHNTSWKRASTQHNTPYNGVKKQRQSDKANTEHIMKEIAKCVIM